ncbi:glutamine synthetase III family protein [Gallalistipes aquisgranensis]|uniref:glutamine synthetase III family protein n=1 Tax=Gallalistipes aquisgranensis TaxID=2779358 RepID=UPI001CF8A2DF|nr:glutamine synthetase III [Gallalistipes aquisgranensis]MBE5032944.1 glutamine synthetase III [Gallalistipes aquisgranensis]
MATLRFKALDEISRRELIETKLSDKKISDYFGIDVFDREKMRQYLPKDVFDSVNTAIEENRRLDRKVANQVAVGMKAWAMERGATHYTHWFQPLNDSTAEKHDAFFEPLWGGGSFETFRGELLVQQEPDASSFPNGGLRNTFEARGYSAWDPTSPAFLIDRTLCIPSIFVAYTGEALDFKTPLLKSLAALDRAAVDVCQYFDKDVTKVVTTLGWEQEYFLVDEALFNARPDLAQTGRTLMGHTAAKDQQLDDHYWGAIPERVISFMKEFEEQAYRLGIPLKTRHNEVAPNQFECAPMFEEANIAVDHNTLLMTVMRKTAAKHKLKVLFHEKPFMGVNGSGKHCNWSLATNTGVNLLSPGKTPKTNIQFLAFFVNAMKAAHDYGTLMMASIASETNSHRLGGHEAPPSVLSVFAGSTMNAILDQIEARISDKKLSPDEKTEIKLDIGKIPEILVDNTDRNRTSPFAFTGNRFEFRATGSSSNCALPLIVINTAVTEQLIRFKNEVDALIEKNVKKDEAILQIIRKYIIESKKIRFEGNGYSREWQEEAAKRGLRGIGNVPLAFKEYLSPESIALFERHKVLNKTELQARYEIKNETFVKKVQIESRVLADLAANHIIPTAIKYQNVLIENVKGIKEIFPKEFENLAAEEIKTIRQIAEHVKYIREHSFEMVEARKKWNNVDNIAERAIGYETEIRPFIENIRYHIDKLELIVDDQLWPLPKYRELMSIN